MDRSLRRTGERQIQAGITFFYYRDLPAAQKFYEDVLGLRMMVDQGFCKIYQVSPTSFVGLVDEKQGSHSASETKSVTLSFVTKEIDEWYEYLAKEQNCVGLSVILVGIQLEGSWPMTLKDTVWNSRNS
jgi:predicted enzyme related to lactoylglutathione lyase